MRTHRIRREVIALKVRSKCFKGEEQKLHPISEKRSFAVLANAGAEESPDIAGQDSP